MPEALPPTLEQRLRATLLRCGPFDSDRALRAVFVDARIAVWRDSIPDNAPSRGQRVALLVAALLDQSTPDGENALVLFLRVLAGQVSAGDACHGQLAQLADEVAGIVAVDASSGEAGLAPERGSNYQIHINGGQVGVIGDNAHIEGGIKFGK